MIMIYITYNKDTTGRIQYNNIFLFLSLPVTILRVDLMRMVCKQVMGMGMGVGWSGYVVVVVDDNVY